MVKITNANINTNTYTNKCSTSCIIFIPTLSQIQNMISEHNTNTDTNKNTKTIQRLHVLDDLYEPTLSPLLYMNSER